MTNYNLEELKSLNYQLILSALAILSIIVSMTLTYNEKLKMMGKNLFSNDLSSDILKINRSFALLITLGFLYLNLVDKKQKKQKNNSQEYADLQICASLLTLLADGIVLYVALFDKTYQAISLENPEL